MSQSPRMRALVGLACLTTLLCGTGATAGTALAGPSTGPSASATANGLGVTVRGTSLTVRGALPGGGQGALDVLVDDQVVGTARAANGAVATTIHLKSVLPGGQHQVAVRWTGSGDVLASSIVTAPVPHRTRMVQAAVKPSTAKAGDEVTVTVRLLDEAGHPVANEQVVVSALTAGGYREVGNTGSDGTAKVVVEVPRGTKPQQLRAATTFAGDEMYASSSGAATLAVVAGGLPAAADPSTPASAQGPVTPDVPASVAPTPQASRTVLPAAAPALHRSRWALPARVVLGEGVLGFLGLVVGLAAGARQEAPTRRPDDEDLDRFIL